MLRELEREAKFRMALVSFPVMDAGSDGKLRPIGMDLIRECPPLVIYWLPEVLRAHGIETVPIDLISDGRLLTEQDLTAMQEVDLIGLSATSMSWPSVLRGAKLIQNRLPHKPLVFGGPHPTLFDDYVLSRFPDSFVIRGEAEMALPLLCEAIRGRLSLESVPNLSFRRDGRLLRNPQGPRLSRESLSELPPPNFSKLPAGIYQGLSIESSRGCPFDCSFCSTNYRKSYRPQIADVFVDKLEALLPHIEKTKLKMTHVVDDEFTMNQNRVIEIAHVLRKRGMDIKLTYDARANDLHNEELVELLGPYTYEFLVGAECGYDEGLRRIGKGTTTEFLERAAKNLCQARYAEKAHFSFIIGLPWETVTEVERTISFASHLAATYGVKVLIQWYCQIPGSNLWAESRKRGKVSALFYDEFGYFRNPYLFFSGVRISPDEIWRLSDIIFTLKWVLRLDHKNEQPIAYNIPGAIAEMFPRNYNVGFDTLRDAVA